MATMCIAPRLKFMRPQFDGRWWIVIVIGLVIALWYLGGQ